jgi:hypothetical protein
MKNNRLAIGVVTLLETPKIDLESIFMFEKLISDVPDVSGVQLTIHDLFLRN